MRRLPEQGRGKRTRNRKERTSRNKEGGRPGQRIKPFKKRRSLKAGGPETMLPDGDDPEPKRWVGEKEKLGKNKKVI